MENSHSHGTISLPPTPDREGVASYLNKICKDRPIAPLITALGVDANTHLVGGALRDLFIGETPQDFDLAVSLAPELIISRLNSSGIKTIDVSAKHGTVIAVIDEQNIEITSFQAHVQNTAEALRIEDDLGARDFTINAIAYNPHTYLIIDSNGGLEDIKERKLKCVGDPVARFQEDPLRILRMIRFGPASNFIVDQETWKAAKSLIKLLSNISVERIRSELDRILLSVNVTEALRALLDIGAFEIILPEILPSVGIEQNEFHYEDVFSHTVTVTGRTPKERLLRWIAIFHDLGKPATLSVDEDGRRHFYGHEKISEQLAKTATERLKFSHSDRDTICNVVREHMRPIDCGLPGVRRIMRDLGENYPLWRTFKVADAPPVMEEQEWLDMLTRFDGMIESERQRLAGAPYGKLALNGEDLKLLGFKPGPEMGKMLKFLEEMVIEDPEKNNKEILTKIIEERFSTK